MTTHFFSYDEEGHTFFNNEYDLLKDTPRIEDCYVYVGNESQEDISKNDGDYREVNVLEYIEELKEEAGIIQYFLKEENEKLNKRLFHEKEDKKYYEEKYIHERDENRRMRLIDLQMIHYEQMKEENKKLKEENKKLTSSQFDYGIFKSEKYNMEKMLNELHSEKNKLKEENEKLKHTMRHTKGGEYCWSDSGSSSEEDDD